MENPTEIRPDIQAYMIQAAQNIAAAQSFVPASEAETLAWMTANAAPICEEAKRIMRDLLNKVARSKGKVERIMTTRVWTDINRRELTRRENRSFDEILS